MKDLKFESSNLPSRNLDIKQWEQPTQGREYPGQQYSMTIRDVDQ